MGPVRALEKTVEQQIIELHEAMLSSMRRTVGDAIEIGRLLSEKKAELDHGAFLPWIERELPFSQPTAFRYMQCFRHKARLFSVNNLQEAYRIAQIEDQRIKAPEKQKRLEKAREKLRAAGPVRVDSAKREKQQKGRTTEELLRDAERVIESGAAVSGKLRLDGRVENLAQQNIFEALDRYIYSFPTVSQQLEAAHNLIKRLRGIVSNLQRESVKVK